jgi:hypothetical protein
MKCINIEQKLSELLDGELSSPEKATVETHLESCDSCRNSLANMQLISGNIKQNLAVSAPSLLDENVMNAFKNFYSEKLAEVTTEKPQTQKIGWFGIPKFAFAAALLLFGLVGFTAFQIGKISASEVSIISPEIKANETVNDLPSKVVAENKEPNVENDEKTKIIEIPVIKEKIVEVPVIKEKIVTRTIYVDREKTEKKENVTRPSFNRNDDVAMESSINENGFVTQTNLKGFQPVSDLKVKITKKEEE